jgi:tetratricopeptide (TPR) repeat protein
VSHRNPRKERDLDLLARVWEADRVLDYPLIRELLSPLDVEQLLASEEFTLLLLFAYLRLGDQTKAATLLQAAAPLFPATRSDRNRIRFLNAAANHTLRQGRLSDTEDLANEMLVYGHRTRDDSTMLSAFIVLGIVAGTRGDYIQALRHFTRALASSHSDSGRWISVVHHNMAVAYRELGFAAESQRHFEEAAKKPRPSWVEGGSMLDRALLLLQVGDEPAAAELARRAMECFERIQSPLGIAEARTVLARIATAEAEVDQARQELESAFEMLQPGDALLTAQAHEEAAVVAALSGDTEARVAAQATAEQLYLQMEASPRIERMRLRLGVLSATAV